MQALETVPGINQVSEGHAAVPAIRGMARGRVLLLIDGARVTSERRVGPSATFLDPAVLEGIDVARGPGSVAYGSDALGGVISMRTRNAEAGSPLRVRGNAHVRSRHAGSTRRGRGLQGPLPRAASSSRVTRVARTTGAVRKTTATFSIRDGRTAGSRFGAIMSVGPGVADGRVAERLRPRCRASPQQLADRPLLLSVRELEPLHDVVRPRESWRPRTGRVHRLPRLVRPADGSGPVPDGDHAAAASSAPTCRPTISMSRAARRNGSARARLEFGLDVNGRYDLEALDIIQALRSCRKPHAGHDQRVGRGRAPHGRRCVPAGRYGRHPAAAAVRRRSRRQRHHQEHRRVLRRPRRRTAPSPGSGQRPPARSRG